MNTDGGSVCIATGLVCAGGNSLTCGSRAQVFTRALALAHGGLGSLAATVIQDLVAKREARLRTRCTFCVGVPWVCACMRALSGHAAARPACPLRRSLAGPVHVNARIARSMQQPKLARVERLLALVEFCLVAVALAALPKPGQTRARARQRVCVHPRRGARISDSPLTW